jgi:hypothetical protein
VGDSCLILSEQNVAPQILMCSISTNIHGFSQFPWLIIQFLPKASVMTMTTLTDHMNHEVVDLEKQSKSQDMKARSISVGTGVTINRLTDEHKTTLQKMTWVEGEEMMVTWGAKGGSE